MEEVEVERTAEWEKVEVEGVELRTFVEEMVVVEGSVLVLVLEMAVVGGFELVVALERVVVEGLAALAEVEASVVSLEEEDQVCLLYTSRCV